MADPKIKVGADMSAAIAEVGKLEAAAAKVNAALNNGSVGIDVKQAKADLAALSGAASDVATALSKVGDYKGPGDTEFAKIVKALENAAEAGDNLEKILHAVGQSTSFDKSIRGSKQIADNIDRARKAQEILTREGVKLTNAEARSAKDKFDEWKTSGARGTSKLKGAEFDEWVGGGYRKHSIDGGEAERNRRKVLESLGVKAGGSMGEASGRMPGRTRGWGAVGGAIGGAIGSLGSGGDGFFSSLGNAGGGMLGMAAGAATLNPVIGTIVGSIGSKVLGAVGSALDASLQRVIADAINLTDLRHSIGATNTDFGVMRQGIRSFTSDLRLTNEEASRLARTFSDSVGRSMSEHDLAGGTRLGAGFSRSFGLDPSMGTAFFGNMRRMGQDGDSRLALKIGEVVTRGGVTPQMGAVLDALKGFTEQQTRISFTKANTEGYASFMTSMFGGSLAGSKDVGTVTSAMGAADAALRQGGAFGEASKAFSLGTYQRRLPGFNVFDLDAMKEQGAFGTIRGAFGKDSAAYKFAQDRGDRGMMGKYSRWASGKGSDESALSMQMKQLEKYYGGNTDELRKSIMSHFGVGVGQATALYDAYKRPEGLGGLEKQLKAAGIDTGKILPQQIGELAQVAGMDKGQIKTHAAKLLGDSSLNLSEQEKKALQSASVDEQRKAVLQITALHDTVKDEGERMDQANKTLTRLTDAVTTQLVPAVLAMKEFMLALVQHFMPNTAVLDAPGSSTFDPKKLSPGQKKIMGFISDHGTKAGWSTEKTNAAIAEAWYESKLRNVSGPVITDPKSMHYGQRAAGPLQIMPKTAQSWGANPGDMWGTLSKGLDQYGKYYDKWGVRGAAVAWQSGEGNVSSTGQPIHNRSDGHKTVAQYSSDVVATYEAVTKLRAADLTTVLPGVGPVTSVSPQHGNRDTAGVTGQGTNTVTIRLEDPRGKPIPHVVVNNKTGAPVPAGTSGGW